ncbi:hypothetical protein A2630_03845 [Candidatus Woesebacteria bacterium RIFCSPHIGHO2_01_FULL_44_10]|nr:MAG: hypothetical protein A2630_03845 [Candidatus Woesebacteria bacterium RIFCSPHIGHO2_01_FULL_44_10]
MLALNRQLFEEFQRIHDMYTLNEEPHQDEFNRVGEKVMKVVREYEQKLCQTQEGTYNQYTSKLAQKFQDEVRARFPMIDHVGIITKTSPAFALKKINL